LEKDLKPEKLCCGTEDEGGAPPAVGWLAANAPPRAGGFEICGEPKGAAKAAGGVLVVVKEELEIAPEIAPKEAGPNPPVAGLVTMLAGEDEAPAAKLDTGARVDGAGWPNNGAAAWALGLLAEKRPPALGTALKAVCAEKAVREPELGVMRLGALDAVKASGPLPIPEAGEDA
jgi:hypothetical protein